MTVEKKNSVDKILEEIEKLTVLELSELVSAMEKKFGVSAQAPVAQFAGVAAAAPGAAAAEEKTEFTVILCLVKSFARVFVKFMKPYLPFVIQRIFVCCNINNFCVSN